MEKERLSFSPIFNLSLLAALTPPDIEVSITDENIENIDFDTTKGLDMAAITVLTSTASRAYKIADIFRAKGITVVLGGIHTSFLPEESSLHADSIVIGEAENIWPQLIDDFKNGKLKKYTVVKNGRT